MGCDSHICIERRIRKKWEPLILGSSVPYDDRKEPLSGLKSRCYDLKSRCYDLFAVLAGVRNGIGVEPLFQGRGIPKDASMEARREHLDGAGDYHSATWFTADEVQEFDWSGICHRVTYMLPAHAFLEWQKAGRIVDNEDIVSSQIYLPPSNEGCRVVSEDEMTLLLIAATPDAVSPLDEQWQKTFKRLGGKSKKLDVRRRGAFAKVNTPVTYRAIVPHFVSSTLPALVALGNPTDTRVLMWFDN